MVSVPTTSTPGVTALVFHQRVAHEVAHHLAAVLGQSAPGHQLVEADEQLLGHGHREAHEVVAHGRLAAYTRLTVTPATASASSSSASFASSRAARASSSSAWAA